MSKHNVIPTLTTNYLTQPKAVCFYMLRPFLHKKFLHNIYVQNSHKKKKKTTTIQFAMVIKYIIPSIFQEEVYVIEDESAKQDLGHEKLSISSKLLGARKRRGVRHTLECRICHRGFYKPSLLEAHMQQHEGLRPYTCVLCAKSYARANLLESHLRQMHNNADAARIIYACPSCNKVYTANRSLKYHMRRTHERNHESESPDARHICEECGKCFARKAHLTRHKMVHGSVEGRRYCCECCDRRFYTKENMVDHLLRKHGNKNLLLRCRKCGRIFQNSVELNAHGRKHKAMAVVQ